MSQGRETMMEADIERVERAASLDAWKMGVGGDVPASGPSTASIADQRIRLGMKQTRLSIESGILPARIGDYEQRPERVGNMTLRIAGRLASALRLTLDEFHRRYVTPDMSDWTALTYGPERGYQPLEQLLGRSTRAMSMTDVYALLLDLAVERWAEITVLDLDLRAALRVTGKDIDRRNKELQRKAEKNHGKHEPYQYQYQ